MLEFLNIEYFAFALHNDANEKFQQLFEMNVEINHLSPASGVNFCLSKSLMKFDNSVFLGFEPIIQDVE